MDTRGFDYVAIAIVIIGAINWGLIGLLNFDLVSFLFGNMTWFSRVVYTLVGISGLYLFSLFGRVNAISHA